MEPTQSVELIVALENADPDAARDVFDRYTDRLVALAHKNLSAQMKRRVDPEDVVQSVYRSFFRQTEAGRFTISKAGDLWRLLAAITIAKVKGQVELHTAQKRDVSAEVNPDPTRTCYIIPEAIQSEPTAEQAAAITEELRVALESLDTTSRKVVELAMQNCDTREISHHVARSERTVRRTIQMFRQQLEHRLLDSA